jgi:5-methylthioadenosine/S-adenosylhomocysteine deaminase
MRFAAATNLEAKLGASSSPPAGVGEKGRRTLIKGGVVVSMDEAVGNLEHSPFNRNRIRRV